MSVFDVHLLDSASQPPNFLCGAVLCGLNSSITCTHLTQRQPKGIWRHTAVLSSLVGPADSRFPAGSPTVIELHLDNLQQQFRQPSANWWPLMDGLSRRGQFLRVLLRPDVSELVGLRHLAQDFPRARLLIDPFRQGPNPAVMGQIRMAELPNLWLTTLGAFPGSGPLWPYDKLAEAFHFVSGEVGAGKLLFASGLMTETLNSTPDPENWLAGFQCLDEDQRRLILEINSRELFAGSSELPMNNPPV
jgi:hypothetical protein